MNIVSSITSSIVSSIIAASSTIAAWFRLLTTDPAASSPTQGTTTFTRASAANYIDGAGVLRSAAVDTPRYQDGGLLIEQASTNFLSNSEDFAVFPWTVTGAANVSMVNTIVAPDGTTTADTLNLATNVIWGGNALNVQQSGLVSSAAYTCSIFIKSGGATTCTLRLRDQSTGAVQDVVTALTASWQRVSVSLTTGAGTTAIAVLIGATDGDVHIWGAQLETSSKATSYIKTLGASVTRAADICYTDPANIPTLANGATFVWKGALPVGSVYHAAFRSSPNHTIIRRRSNGDVEPFIGGIFLGLTGGIDTAVHTYAVRTNGSNLHEFLIDGVVVRTSTSTGLIQPTAPMYIGSYNGNTEFLNDSAQSFTMYDTALTDAEIQGLG